MKYCEKCNKQHEENSNYCSNCGTRLQEVVKVENSSEKNNGGDESVKSDVNHSKDTKTSNFKETHSKKFTDILNEMLEEKDKFVKKFNQLDTNFQGFINKVKTFWRDQKILIYSILLLCIFITPYVIEATTSVFEFFTGNFNLSISWSKFIDVDYRVAMEILEEEGFENIELVEQNTLESSENNNQVVKVIIDNDDKFNRGDEVNRDDNVTVVYDTVVKIPLPFSSSAMIGENYEEAYDLLLTAGYKNVSLQPLNDLSGRDNRDNRDNNVDNIYSIIIGSNSDVSNGYGVAVDEEIIIAYHSVLQINAPINSNEVYKENVNDIQTLFEDSGFTNIKLVEVDDVTLRYFGEEGAVKDVKINGNLDFSIENSYEMDVEVLIRYQSTPEKMEVENETILEENASVDDETDSLNPPFPVEIAQRVAVVSITNNYATDVFLDDGSARDSSKYHSYSDTSGYYLSVSMDGEWAVKDENTWAVEEILLKTNSGIYFKATLDITYDGTNYVVEDGIVIVGSFEAVLSEDEYTASFDEIISSPKNTYLIVPPSLVEEDR